MADLQGGIAWGADVPISMPEPLPSNWDVFKDCGGIALTNYGVAHNFNQADLEVYTTPIFAPAPQGLAGEIG